MNAVHDVGGMPGWGALSPPDPGEPPFSAGWEKRAFALALLSMRVSGTNLDAFRYSMSRLDRSAYFDEGYYGRWLNGAENLLLDSAIIAPGAIDDRARNLAGADVEEPDVPEPHQPDYRPSAAGSLRTVDTAPAFGVKDRVRVRDLDPPGHTRLTAYTRGHEGVVEIVQPAQVLPDTNAHFLGENPQYVYSVRFSARELWGPDSEPFDVNVDLYESYLEAVP
jgi:nitrile hydratase subunit beta